MVKDLQNILKELRVITIDLDRNISSLKELLCAKEFISDNLGEKIKKNLEEIKMKQTEFASKYETLDSCEFSKKYIVLENELFELQKRLEENDNYIRAIKFFLSIHSADEKTEQIIQNRKQDIINKDIEVLENNELQALAEPYNWLYEAYFEKDAKKKFSLIYKLSSINEQI